MTWFFRTRTSRGKTNLHLAVQRLWEKALCPDHQDQVTERDNDIGTRCTKATTKKKKTRTASTDVSIGPSCCGLTDAAKHTIETEADHDDRRQGITEEVLFNVSPCARQVQQRKERRMTQLTPAEKREDIESHFPTLTRKGFFDCSTTRKQSWTQVVIWTCAPSFEHWRPVQEGMFSLCSHDTRRHPTQHVERTGRWYPRVAKLFPCNVSRKCAKGNSAVERSHRLQMGPCASDSQRTSEIWISYFLGKLRKQQLGDATEVERHAMRSALGALAYLARESRPDLSGPVSILQGRINRATGFGYPREKPRREIGQSTQTCASCQHNSCQSDLLRVPWTRQWWKYTGRLCPSGASGVDGRAGLGVLWFPGDLIVSSVSWSVPLQSNGAIAQADWMRTE